MSQSTKQIRMYAEAFFSKYLMASSPSVSVPTYTYPDGFQYTTAPKHGDFWNVWDPHSNGGETISWEYSGKSQSWTRHTGNSVPTFPAQSIPPTPAPSYSTPIYHSSKVTWAGIDLGFGQSVYIDYTRDPPAEEQRAPPKCECGAHKVNSNQHSDWCAIKENT